MPGEAVIMAPEECGMNSNDELIVDGISSLCTTTINLDNVVWDDVASNLQILSFGGRDAGDGTAVSYYKDGTYRFSSLYDGFTTSTLSECTLESSTQWDAMACTG